MIRENQIRKFKDGTLPNILVNFYSENKGKWTCSFQEDFKYPYISLTENQLVEETDLIGFKI